MDVTWTSAEDSLPTVHTLPEDGFFPEVGFSEPRSVAQKQKLIRQFFRTEVGCPETKTDPLRGHQPRTVCRQYIHYPRTDFFPRSVFQNLGRLPRNKNWSQISCRKLSFQQNLNKSAGQLSVGCWPTDYTQSADRLLTVSRHITSSRLVSRLSVGELFFTITHSRTKRMRPTRANYDCLVNWFILSTSFILVIWIIFVDWIIGLIRPFRYFVSAGLFVLFMLVGIFEPNRSFATFGLLDTNLHHLTPFTCLIICAKWLHYVDWVICSSFSLKQKYLTRVWDILGVGLTKLFENIHNCTPNDTLVFHMVASFVSPHVP